MRKAIPKQIRQKVYEKHNGHCAYCGCELEYKDMQVDHIDSIERASWEGRIEAKTVLHDLGYDDERVKALYDVRHNNALTKDKEVEDE